MSSRTVSGWAAVGGELLVVAHVRPLPARSHWPVSRSPNMSPVSSGLLSAQALLKGSQGSQLRVWSHWQPTNTSQSPQCHIPSSCGRRRRVVDSLFTIPFLLHLQHFLDSCNCFCLLPDLGLEVCWNQHLAFAFQQHGFSLQLSFPFSSVGLESHFHCRRLVPFPLLCLLW